jgi:hypothetical protein
MHTTGVWGCNTRLTCDKRSHIRKVTVCDDVSECGIADDTSLGPEGDSSAIVIERVCPSIAHHETLQVDGVGRALVIPLDDCSGQPRYIVTSV